MTTWRLIMGFILRRTPFLLSITGYGVEMNSLRLYYLALAEGSRCYGAT